MLDLKLSSFSFNIDVVGSCNLKCPSCPVGNSEEIQNPTGFMSPDLLNSIVKKATSECNVSAVSLYNWTEPLLHPKLPELVKIVQSYGVPCNLSSNLNILKNVDLLMSANPTTFRISNSGFTQEIYGATHKGGNIERVKSNMIALAESKKKTNSNTKIHVLYHRYLTNLNDEVLMEEFAKSLGFEFIPVWAFMMPLEKILAYVDSVEKSLGKEDEVPIYSLLTLDDYETINKLALPLKEAYKISSKYSHRACILKDTQVTIDFQGNVQLCCGVFDSKKFTLAPYLTTSISALQSLKYSDNSEVTCSKCMKHGIHVYGTYGYGTHGAYELNEIAIQNVMSHSPIIGFQLFMNELVFTSLGDFFKKVINRIKKLIRIPYSHLLSK